MTQAEKSVADSARAQGFALVGFAPLRRLDERETFYSEWLKGRRHGTMAYLAREPERRFDPRTLDARLKSVVSLGYPYQAPAYPQIDWKSELRGRIAAYALGPDYHGYVLKKARAVGATIGALRPDAIVRAYVDTGPVFERDWGAESRLGWFGKNTTLLNRDRGSYFFLAEIFTNLEFESSSAPYREHCGTCRQCLDLCPTGALLDGFVMESRVCISYLTIEHRGPIPLELRSKIGNWVFGCDICQEVCPWNQASGESTPELAPYLPDLLALDAAAFSRRYSKSAIRRTKRRGLLRNAAVVMGNSKNRDAIGPLARVLHSEPEPIVRSHAAWALGEIGGKTAKLVLERSCRQDTDPDAARAAGEALERMN